MSSIQALRDALGKIQPGPITDTDAHQRIIQLLQNCWEQFSGASDSAMSLFKLDRAEQLSWSPSLLKFIMERHGATVLGSTRAELQEWSVDLKSERVWYVDAGYRQLRPTAQRVDVNPIVTRVLDAVKQGPGSNCDLAQTRVLVWHDANRISIYHGVLIPNDGYPRTIQGRRRRFRTKLTEEMIAIGWQPLQVKRAMTFGK
jgi:hypothetical protein